MLFWYGFFNAHMRNWKLNDDFAVILKIESPFVEGQVLALNMVKIN